MARRLRRRGTFRRRRTTRRAYRRSYRSFKRFKRGSKALHLRRSTLTSQIVYPSGAAASPYIAGLQFQLADLINPSEFTSLFQLYRINCVVVSFIPNYNVNQIPATGTAANIPIIGWAIDYRDGTTPGSVPVLQELQRYKERPFTRPFKVKIWPATGDLSFVTSSTYGYGLKRKQWQNSQVSTVKYFGLKYAVYNFAANQQYVWNLRYTIYASFKDTQ